MNKQIANMFSILLGIMLNNLVNTGFNPYITNKQQIPKGIIVSKQIRPFKLYFLFE